MMNLVILSTVFIFWISMPCAFGATPFLLEELDRFNFVSGCDIFRSSGELFRSFPGDFCAFDDRDFFATGSWRELGYFNKKQEMVWSLRRGVHHQLNWNLDKSELLVLSPRVELVDGKRVYSDDFLRVNRNGKIVAEQNSLTLFKSQKITRKPYHVPPGHVGFGTFEIELSHFNSFYQIPDNPYSQFHLAFKKGNFILNDRDMGVFILSSDLKKVLWYHRPPYSELTHDAQVTRLGKVIYFSNREIPATAVGPYSTVKEYDPRTDLTKDLFKADPPQTFYSDSCGGVQLLSDDVALVSTMFNGYYIVDVKTNKLLQASSTFLTKKTWPRLLPTQQVKAHKFELQ